IDPRVMIGDMSGDAISYSIERIQLTDSLLKTIKARYSEPGKSYHELRGAFFSLTGQAAEAAGIISRYIGGIYIDRSMVGQPGATQPYTPVPYADQKRAMAALSKHLFAPDAFKSWDGLYAYLQPQRRGFSVGTDPKIYDRALNMQRGVLMHLMSPVVLKRINDTKAYGNEYSLGEYMTDLTNAVFKDDVKGAVNTFRQNLQMEYVGNLIDIFKNKSMWGNYDNPSQSMALYSLKEIQKTLTKAKSGDVETQAHRERIVQNIKLALKGKQAQESGGGIRFF
ncbi:MAG TPA: zinc-dependent metalloprotease, partial [Patescibacteria group bacterium]|nr:zinc-dependent metalloprotease [Patescibacteria group bacterium]